MFYYYANNKILFQIINTQTGQMTIANNIFLVVMKFLDFTKYLITGNFFYPFSLNQSTQFNYNNNNKKYKNVDLSEKATAFPGKLNLIIKECSIICNATQRENHATLDISNIFQVLFTRIST